MNKITTQLDYLYDLAICSRDMQVKQWDNIMISGLAGSGKTSIVKAWAEEKGVLLVAYDLRRSVDTIYEEDAFGILRPKKAENPVAIAKQLIFDFLKKHQNGQEFILFLDDYHLANPHQIAAINHTIDTHKIVDPVSGEEIELENLLFTIAIKTEGL